ncbi:MAG: META domain-containing protein [Betaproteobacteria bacterium]
MRRWLAVACGLSLFLPGLGATEDNQTPLQACYQSAAGDRVAANECLNRKVTEAEEALSSVLSTIAQDTTRPEAEAGREESADTLSQAQQRFLQFRKANCAWYGARINAEASSGDITKDCIIRMTIERTAELRAKPRSPPPMARVEAPPPRAALQDWQGFEWKLSKLAHDGEQIALADTVRITATFYTAGRVAGMASVNRYFGSYKMDEEDRITWTTPAFGATRIAGPARLMQQEQIYLDALSRVTHVRLDGTELVLDSDDHKMMLTFVK